VTITATGLALSPTSPTQYAIVGNRTISRSTDFTTGGDFFANTLNDELDQQTIFAQQNAEGIVRSLQAPQTDPTTINMILPRSTVRASKVLAFDSSGNPTATEFIGSNRGNWATSTIYYVRDIVKDTSNSNIYNCLTQHTSTGSQPISSNADVAKWSLLVDAAAAATSAAAAATSATAAASSASGASTSATNASNSASTASTQASNASTSATSASGSASTATTQATAAGTSATSAAASATSATASATTATTQATTATTQATNASTSATNAATSATTATTQATTATTAATTATTQATAASTSATNAATSASNASTSATAAAASATAAAASFDAFDDIYLGAKASNPTVDNDGNALTTGDQYFNTVSNELRVWNGSTWQAASTVGGTVASLSVTGNTTLGDGSADTLTINATVQPGMIISGTDNTNAALRITQLGTGNALLVEDSSNPDSTPFVIDATGAVAVGATTSAALTISGTPQLSQGGASATNSRNAFSRWDASATGFAMQFGKSRSGTVGTFGIVSSGDSAGQLQFFGDDGAAFVQLATIGANVDGTPGTNDMPGRLVFSTTADGASTVTERMRIDSAGDVGIGTTAPVTKLEVAGNNTTDFSSTASSISGTTLTIGGTVTGTVAVGSAVFAAGMQPYTRITAFGTGTGGAGTYTVNIYQTFASAAISGSATDSGTVIRITDTDTSQAAGQPTGGLQFYTSDASTPTAGVGAYVAAVAESNTPDTALVFGTRDNSGGGIDANERMRIDSSGNVGIGTSSPAYPLQVSTASETNIAITGGTSSETNIFFGDSGSAVIGRITYNNNGDYMRFYVNAAERMRIDSSGNAGIGNTTPSSYNAVADNLVIGTSGSNGLTIVSGTANDGSIHFADGTSGADTDRGQIFYSHAGNYMVFGTDATERMRINSSGNLLVGTTSSTVGGQTPKLGVVGTNNATIAVDCTASSGASGIHIRRSVSGTGEVMTFDSLTTRVGSISITGSATAYNTSSDYRLKENITPMTGALAKVALLKPVTYKWKVDGSNGEGFIAHELAEVVEGCVTGEKDAVDADGNPKYQGIDTSFLVATLTAAIQELKTMNDTQAETINALTARITALENA
jgi:hypothetical protein